MNLENFHEHEHEHESHHHENSFHDLIKIIISGLFLIFLIVFKEIFKIKNQYFNILFLIPYLISGREVICGAFKKICKGKALDEDFLMTVATIAAFLTGKYSEAVAVMLFFQIGELLEEYASSKSKKSISSLLKLRPDYANRECDGVVERVKAEDIKKGDIIIIKPGERVPLDGIITDGSSSLDTSSLSGESYPKDVKENDKVLSGCINLTGLLKLKVTEELSSSTLSKIISLTENAKKSSSKSEKFITRFSKIYTPVVVISALLIALIPSFITGDISLWVERAIVFIVVSCPCALVVSVPLCFFMGMGRASKHGILIKGSEYIEKLSKCDTFIFDKTGTLTKGSFEVTAVHPNEYSKEYLTEICAYAENFSNHPISKTIKDKYSKEIDIKRIEKTEEVPGKGVKALIDGKEVVVGNSILMEENSISWRKCHHKGTIIHIAVDKVYAGHIVISDIIKDDAKESLKSLKKLGIKDIIMLSGDNEEITKTIADFLDIKKYYSNLLPKDKLDILNIIKENSKITSFTGDGINDAPVLAGSDLSIAMGGIGSDAAIEVSDVIIMNDEINKIPKAVKLSRRVLNKVKFNIFLILFIKFSVLFLGAFGILGLWAAVFADVGSLIISIFISIIDKQKI